MRRRVTVVLLLAALTIPRAVAAQDPQWPERFWISGGGGVQTGGSRFDDTFTLPLYAETERVTVDYPVKEGAAIDVRGGYRLWKRVTVGAGVTHYSRRSGARVRAELPHPFFDNRFRQIEGTTSAVRGETAAHVLLGWMLPLSRRMRMIVMAGPSFVNVEQTLVANVQYSEVYPYDTAEFSGATTRRATRGATGFNAGADVTWMFGHRFGAGALVQVTRARARLKAGDGRTIAVDAGGAQAAAGIRFFF
jgi:hypothetical protein